MKLNYKITSLILALIMLVSILTGCPSPAPNFECPAHVDANNDDACDMCRVSVVEYVDFFNFNDLHGKFEDSDTQPGVDEITTYLERARLTNEHVVFLSTGDMWQGSSESNLTNGNIIVDWMNYLDFDAMSIGNHEFDWGTEFIEENGELAEFPFLAINIYYRDTNEPVEWCEPSVMIERGNVKIGLIGAIGDIISSISSEMTQEIYFKTGNDLTELVKAESERLRKEGADMIVYMLHDGASQSGYGDIPDYKIKSFYDPSLSDGYVDLVFEGHTHRQYVYEDSWGVYHLQGGGDNSDGFMHVEAKVNFANGKVTVTQIGAVEHSEYKNLADSPIVDDLLNKYWDEIKVAYEKLGHNNAYRNSDEITDLVAKLYYEAGVAKWGDEYDIVLGGAYLKLRSPYKIEYGDVYYSDIQSVLPFDNKIVLCSIKGVDLLDKFYNTSNGDYHIYFGDLKASEVDPDGTYYIITDTYTSTYSYNNITEIEYYDNFTFARDLVAAYVKEGNWNK